MDWLLEKLQLKSPLENIFHIVQLSPDEVPITLWHSAACAAARILPCTKHYAARTLSSMTESLQVALSRNGVCFWPWCCCSGWGGFWLPPRPRSSEC